MGDFILLQAGMTLYSVGSIFHSKCMGSILIWKTHYFLTILFCPFIYNAKNVSLDTCNLAFVECSQPHSTGPAYFANYSFPLQNFYLSHSHGLERLAILGYCMNNKSFQQTRKENRSQEVMLFFPALLPSPNPQGFSV